MNTVLARWNTLPPETAASEILPCCGSEAWAEALSAYRPFSDPAALHAASDAIWRTLPDAAWQQAFASHPRLGQSHAAAATAESLRWSAQEQQAVLTPNADDRLELEDANRRYETRFDRIFLVCATGKSTAEILGILNARMANNPEAELHEAAEQQRQITQLRLRRWLKEEQQ